MEIRENEKAMAGYERLRIVAAAHAGSLMLYAVLVEVLARQEFTGPALLGDSMVVRAGVVLLSLGLFVAAGRLRERMLQPRFDALEEALVPGERLRRMLTANVVTFALCDAPAMFGLLLFLLGGGARGDFYLLLSLAAIFLAAHYPGREQWQAWYAQRARLR